MGQGLMIPLDAYGWRAHVVQSYSFDQTARILLGRYRADGRFDLVNLDGTVTTYEEGVALPEDAGWQVPAEAISAIGQAIESFHGNAGHAATETRVLREALERAEARVDKVFDWAIKVNGA